MILRYVGPLAGVDIANGTITCMRDQWTEVPDEELAEELIERDFEAAPDGTAPDVPEDDDEDEDADDGDPDEEIN